MANRVSAQIPLKGGYRIPALAGAKTLCFFMLCAHGKDVWICMTLVAHNVELNIVFNVSFFFFARPEKLGVLPGMPPGKRSVKWLWRELCALPTTAATASLKCIVTKPYFLPLPKELLQSVLQHHFLQRNDLNLFFFHISEHFHDSECSCHQHSWSSMKICEFPGNLYTVALATVWFIGEMAFWRHLKVYTECIKTKKRFERNNVWEEVTWRLTGRINNIVLYSI